MTSVRRVGVWLSNRDRWELATGLLLATVFAVICFTFQDYGVSWDEEFSRAQGVHFFAWYSSGFKNDAVMTHANAEYVYGALYNAIWLMTAKISPFGIYETSHLLIALGGLLSVLFAYRIGKLFSGPRAGFLAALGLTLTPTYYGHSFMNPKDIPFAVLYLMALYYLIRAYDDLPKFRLRTVLVTGVAIGLAMSIRAAGMILLTYFVVLVGFWLIAQHRKAPSTSFLERLKGIRSAFISFVATALVSWVLMLIWWPYGQLRPIANPLLIFLKSTKFTEWHWTVLYRGEYIPASSLPWHYLPGEFLVTLPEFYVLGLGLGLGLLVMWMIRTRLQEHPRNIDSETKLAFFIFISFFPLLAAVIMRPIMYDGTRLFLFLLPPFAVICGIVFARLLSAQTHTILRFGVGILLLTIGVTTAIDMVRLHPYQYVFFNRSSGGLPAANKNYETEYWATSYKEGIEWLMDNYMPDAPVASIRVTNLSNPFLTQYYLSTREPHEYRFLQVAGNDRPNVVLSITRWNQQLAFPGRVLHTVERMGVPLLYVTEVSPPAAQ